MKLTLKKRPLEFNAWDDKKKVMLEDVTIGENGTVGLDFDNAIRFYGSEENLPKEQGEEWVFVFGAQPLQYIGLKDKNKQKLFEGDLLLCEGAKGWMSGDGRLPKKFPSSIAGILLVKFDEGAFTFEWVCAVKDHAEFDKNKLYRSIGYSATPLGKGSQMNYDLVKKKYKYKGDGVTCFHVKKIGNIFQDKNIFKKSLTELIAL